MTLRPNMGVKREYLVLINPTDIPIKAMGHERRINMLPYRCSDSGDFDPNSCIQLLRADTASLMLKNDSQGKGKGPRLVIFLEPRGEALYDRCQELISEGNDEVTSFREAYRELAGTDAPTVGEAFDDKARQEDVESRLLELNIPRRAGWTVGWCELVIQNPELQFENPLDYATDAERMRADTAAQADEANALQKEQQEGETEGDRKKAIKNAAKKAKAAGAVT